MKYDFIIKLKKYITEETDFYKSVKMILAKCDERKNGKIYTFNEHLQAVIYSLLGALKPFKTIEENKENIDNIFFNYDADKIKNTKPEYFINSLKEIKVASILTGKQMKDLNKNVSVLEEIAKTYGTIDNYYNKQIMERGNPYYLAEELADKNSKYKLKNMGIPLVCEYFKNIGIDAAKADRHIRRMFGKNILGFSGKKEASVDEALEYIKEIAEKNNNMPQVEVDILMWLYCAKGQCEICTEKNPKCHKCVIKDYCKL